MKQYSFLILYFLQINPNQPEVLQEMREVEEKLRGLGKLQREDDHMKENVVQTLPHNCLRSTLCVGQKHGETALVKSLLFLYHCDRIRCVSTCTPEQQTRRKPMHAGLASIFCQHLYPAQDTIKRIQQQQTCGYLLYCYAQCQVVFVEKDSRFKHLVFRLLATTANYGSYN